MERIIALEERRPKLWTKTQSKDRISVSPSQAQFNSVDDYTMMINTPCDGVLHLVLNTIVNGKGYLRMAFYMDDECITKRTSSDNVSSFGEYHTSNSTTDHFPANYSQMVEVKAGDHLITVRTWADDFYTFSLGELKCLFVPM